MNSVVNPKSSSYPALHHSSIQTTLSSQNRQSMETFKLIVASLLSPMLICLCLQAIGWLLWLRSRSRRALSLIGAGTLVLTIGGLSGLSYESARAREYAYQPLEMTATLDKDRPGLIVVLGTGFNPDPEMPANSQVSSTFHARLLEGVRIYRTHSDLRLLVSVAGEADAETKARFLDQIVELLQLDPSRVSMITEAKSTAEEAEEVARRWRGEQIVVVTSASHMVRAMQIFSDQELSPIAAPAEFWFTRAGSPDEKIWPRWIPSTDGINSNHQWLYETVASIWQRVSGK